MWNLYLVNHGLGQFIGVAKSMESAREHFGNAAEITPATEEMILERRLTREDRVILAV